MNINELCKEAHENAVAHGWWESERNRNIGMLIALMHSELSEALEEYRNGHKVNEIYGSSYGVIYGDEEDIDNIVQRGLKPEGIPIELADVAIRIFDFCAQYGIDLEKAIEIKMAYNKLRPYRHGGKKA